MANTAHDTVLEATGMAARIARVYAEALAAAAAPRGEADSLGDALDSLVRDVLDADRRVETLFASPAVKKAEKQAAIDAAFGPNAPELLRNFVSVLNQNNRLGLIRAVNAAYRRIRDERAGRVRVRVTSAVPLTDAQAGRLRDSLARSLNAEPVIDARTNPDILGGLVVQVGDRVYDSSVRTRLETLRNHLMASGSYGSNA